MFNILVSGYYRSGLSEVRGFNSGCDLPQILTRSRKVPETPTDATDAEDDDDDDDECFPLEVEGIQADI